MDVGKDGAVIGIELFSPSTLLPELVAAHFGQEPGMTRTLTG